MKGILKSLFVVFCAALMAVPASAQVYLGPRAGVNLASVSTNQGGVETDFQMGICGGLSLRWQIMKRLSIQMEALYSQMGVVSTQQLQAGDVVTTIESTSFLDYVQAPLLLNYEIPLKPESLIPYRVKESFSSIHLYAGGFFGYGLGAASETQTTVNNNDGTPAQVTTGAKADIPSENFNPIDFGAMAGLGISFRLDEEDKHRVGVDARYLLGFSNTSKVSGVTETNSAIQGSIVYSMKLTKRTVRHIN